MKTDTTIKAQQTTEHKSCIYCQSTTDTIERAISYGSGIRVFIECRDIAECVKRAEQIRLN